jgi:hypothetical protein
MTTSIMTTIMSSVFVRSILFTVFSDGFSIFSPSSLLSVFCFGSCFSALERKSDNDDKYDYS